MCNTFDNQVIYYQIFCLVLILFYESKTQMLGRQIKLIREMYEICGTSSEDLLIGRNSYEKCHTSICRFLLFYWFN